MARVQSCWTLGCAIGLGLHYLLSRWPVHTGWLELSVEPIPLMGYGFLLVLAFVVGGALQWSYRIRDKGWS